MTQKIQNGNYGGTIRQQNDGEFIVFFLYNMLNPTRDHTDGDIWDMKYYKTEKTAINKLTKWIEAQ